MLFKYVTAADVSWIKRNLNKLDMVTDRWPDSATQWRVLTVANKSATQQEEGLRGFN